jgi:hypothetical protein
MTGGLIQLVTTGKQDSYLTDNPQITFFKKIYRRHTIFAIEMIKIYTDQQAEYNNKVSFKLNNVSDLISKCYIEINIPTLSFKESPIITNLKENELVNIQKNINKWETLYQNLSTFCSIEILLYQQLIKLLQSININLNVLKQTVTRFNSKYKKNKDDIINLIFNDIYNQINLTGYILQLNYSIVQDDSTTYNSSINIKVSDLRNNIQSYYDNMINNLKYYQSNSQFYQNQYNSLNNKNVNFAWINNLAHYFFTGFEVEIGGQSVESYSADQSYIYQMHHLKAESIDNYNKMIGVNDKINIFDNNIKLGKTLILPLNFWFCKDIGNSLAAVAMSNSSININLKLNNLKNLIYFQDYEQEYYNFLNIQVPYDQKINDALNVQILDYDINSKIASYTCKNINYQLMALQYPGLASINGNDILQTILNTYGITRNEQQVLELSQWINYKINFSNSNLASPENLNVLFRSSLNNFNQYYSLISKPSVTLITESIYLDDLERNKFSSTKLEYVVEIFQENIYDLDNTILHNLEFSIDRPVKELSWVTQPKLFLNGLSEFGKRYNSFDYSGLIINHFYDTFNITLNQLQLTKNIFNSTFYNELQSYKYYNNSLPPGVSTYNFGLFPEENQPSGTANFTMFKGKLVNIYINQNFLDEYFNTSLNPNSLGLILTFYARSYNFFVVEKGMGKMIFATG